MLNPSVFKLSTRKKIGKGGFSTIYRCELQKPIQGETIAAIKITKKSSGSVSLKGAFKDVKKTMFKVKKVKTIRPKKVDTEVKQTKETQVVENEQSKEDRNIRSKKTKRKGGRAGRKKKEVRKQSKKRVPKNTEKTLKNVSFEVEKVRKNSEISKRARKAVETDSSSDASDSSIRRREERKKLADAEISYLRLSQGNEYVLKYLTHVTTKSVTIMVTELCACDLRKLIKIKRFFPKDTEKKKYPIMHINYLVVPVLHALAHVHKLGIIHLDIKEQNILLNFNGVPKLADFGISKVIPGLNTNITSLLGANFMKANEQEVRFGQVKVVGTLRYMSPEVCFGFSIKSGQVGTFSDLWSLGVTLLQLFTGFKYNKVEKPKFKLCQRDKDGDALRKLILTYSGFYKENGRSTGGNQFQLLNNEVALKFRDLVSDMLEVDGPSRRPASQLLGFPGFGAISAAWDDFRETGETDDGYILGIKERTQLFFQRMLST
eukprot:snap_masked-scaffold_14-processed-gene-3.34-mRNA-1 protein AED:1.00 eAED:1.00 QI:0/-1/0/0/-1/1/1/0/488